MLILLLLTEVEKGLRTKPQVSLHIFIVAVNIYCYYTELESVQMKQRTKTEQSRYTPKYFGVEQRQMSIHMLNATELQKP